MERVTRGCVSLTSDQSVMVRAARGLAAAHAAGVVHRDFKPSNVLIDGSGNCLLSDFGLAKLAATVASYWAGIPGGIFTPALTTGAGIGHELWQWTGGALDERLIVLLSMAAFLAAATQAPLTASVVVMEMTGSQPLLFWLLAASLSASVVARQFCPQPFYHLAAGRFRRQATLDAARSARAAAA